MKKRKTLKEAVLADPEKGQPEWDRLVEKASRNPFFQKVLKEAKLEGDISDESDDTGALGLVHDEVIKGVERYIPLDFAKTYHITKSELKVPKGTLQKAVAISSGAFTNLPMTTAFATIACDVEYGVTVTWTRSHLEDATKSEVKRIIYNDLAHFLHQTWDVISEQNEAAGYAVQNELCYLLGKELDEAGAVGTEYAGGKIHDLTDPITWADFNGNSIESLKFLEVVGAVDVDGYGPADYVLCTPDIYWQLLALDQFVSSLYAGSDEVMRTGVAKSMLGVTVLRATVLGAETSGTIYALNSKKAIALVYRRDLTVEFPKASLLGRFPFENPDENEYGFVASVRIGIGMIWAKAVAKGMITPATP